MNRVMKKEREEGEKRRHIVLTSGKWQQIIITFLDSYTSLNV